MRDPSNPNWFRQVLGHYPTGVCVITAKLADGSLVGMTVGSFTSVSLSPPLVAFMPARSSSTWKAIESAGHFCANVLSADQQGICHQLSSKQGDRFSKVSHRPSPSGSPILSDCVAWIDCKVDSVVEAGDHYIVIGAVLDMDIAAGNAPLLFCQGGYGEFAPLCPAD